MKNNKQVAENLKKIGYDGVFGSFSGGNDEGGWDELYAFKLKRGYKASFNLGSLKIIGPQEDEDKVHPRDWSNDAFEDQFRLRQRWEIYNETYEKKASGEVVSKLELKSEQWVPEKRKTVKITKAEAKRIEKMYRDFAEPFCDWLDEAYGSFAGEFYVSGAVATLASGETVWEKNEDVTHSEASWGEF